MPDASPYSPPTPLEQELRQRLRSESAHRLSWAEVMEQALYHPLHGYYSGAPRRIGRGGDFYTAVSVGALYGRLLGELAMELWRAAGRPAQFTLIEQGAHDATLMRDIWEGLVGSELAPHLQLCLVEHRAACRSVQQETLAQVPAERLRWVSDVAELPCTEGLFLCNELLDAFPVHRVRWHEGQWQEGYIVEPEPGAALEWQWCPCELPGVDSLPKDLPEGYTTEFHPAADLWMQSLGASGFAGPVLIADYGYEESEYYAPERSQGTLRRYYQHKADTEFLTQLGHSDLTAHINFSRVIQSAASQGREVLKFLPQGRFLTQLAEPWLRSLDGKMPTAETRALLRQFQSLTHPGHMGAAFRMLLLSGKLHG